MDIAFHCPEIDEAFEIAGLETTLSRWGRTQAHFGNHIIRILIDDNTYELYVLTANEVFKSKMTVNGMLANPVTLAMLITAATDTIEAMTE